MSLYDKLRVDEEATNYVIYKLPEPDLSKIEVDVPSYGNISNIEPLLASIRNERISSAQVTDLKASFGYLESAKDTREITRLWKNDNVGQNSLLEFNGLLHKGNLGHISEEIKNNYMNTFA